MAKRKRLTPASTAFLEAAPETKSAFSGPNMRAAPIADVAREASATAAMEELAQELSQARENGRMVLPVPLEAVDLDYLVRDRVGVQDDEMQALKDSLRARGQQSPVELVALESGHYGLISGWRRCVALRALYDETGDAKFAYVLGLLRQPREHADAYLAMVEENEIRVGLSYFERARIVAKSVEQGVFDNDRAALQSLFQSASRAKRSKIGSFLPVVRALDGALRFPQALGERQGLLLSRALGVDSDLAKRLRQALKQASPEGPEAEADLLATALEPPKASPRDKASADKPQTKAQAEPAGARTVAGGVQITAQNGRIILEGYAVTPALEEKLIAWLRNTV
jgi:hypothetical protein